MPTSTPGASGTTYAWDGKSFLRLDTTAQAGTVTLPDGTLIGGQYGAGKGTHINAKIVAGANSVTFNAFVSTTGGAAQYVRMNTAKASSITVPAGVAVGFEWDGIDTWDVSPTATGTVTSVALTTPGTIFGVSGSPVTSAGTLALTLLTQAKGAVLAAPATAAGTPSFRALLASDIPFTGGLIYSQATIKTAPVTGNVTGTSANGDTVNASTTRLYFASQCPIAANFMQVGMRFHMYGSGLYTTSGTAGVGALAPAATPIVSLVSSTGTVVDIVTSAALQNPAGAANLGFSFDVTGTTRSLGTTGKVTWDGTLRFQAASGAALITVVPTITATIDTTKAQKLVLSVTLANNMSGNNFTIMGLEVTAEPPVAASD